ncbi:MAG TPA: Hsp70 family protein [Pyrinomonadaceae bacterium]|jgi:molecular chaperone DnaK
MKRDTADFGIDLGTTNSAIGVLRGMDVEIIKNNEDFDYTPSVVHIDKSKSMIVGRAAKEKLDKDEKNTYAEFKLQMGTDAEFNFERSGRRMRPEELSAEVLKSLKADVKKRLGEDLHSAVITVPAAFELPQCEATNRAAQLAGITFSPLLQEPVAAALAHGFQSESDRVFWLVYDFGGGTFDAAVMQVRDGMIQVVNHGGDNHLGGKLIDWAIVKEIFIPAILQEHRLTDFRHGNPRWSRAIAKLKQAAEEAKIRLSNSESAEILEEFPDDDGELIEFEYTLRRSELEKLAEPFILRSINICRQVLAERRLGTSSVEKVLLVGGPTKIPYLRERLSDPRNGLGIPLEITLDPMTVVARGAAIFAGTQRIDNQEASVPLVAGQYAIELEYQPTGPDPEPLVGGQVMPQNGESLSGYSIEFVNAEARPPWRSGKVSLTPDGYFDATLWAEKGRKNNFQIELLDKTGRKLESRPDNFSYTIAVGLGETLLIQSIGVAKANNEVQWYFEKGATLPLRKRFEFKTVDDLHKGLQGESIKIPVVEGEHKKADRNPLIGYLEILSADIKRDVPAGTTVEITIELDKSRLVKAHAYIDILDQEFEKVIEMKKPTPDAVVLQQEVEEEKQRLERIKDKVASTADSKVLNVLETIENEKMLEEVESTLDAAQVDRDAADKCQNRLLSLKAAVDKLEEAMEIPSLVAEANQITDWTRQIVEQYGQQADQRKFEILERELNNMIQSNSTNPTELSRKIDQMDALRMKLLTARPDWWVGFLAELEEHRASMTNPALAEQLFSQGMRSVSNNDVEGLKSACRQLLQLLPTQEQKQLGRYGAGVI